MNKNFIFKQQFSLEKRQDESKKIREKYDTKIPIIVEKSKKTKLPNINKCKFLVPENMTIGQFLHVLRRRIELDEKEAIFIFVGDNILPPTSALVSELYEQYKDQDGFLYMSYCNENVFG